MTLTATEEDLTEAGEGEGGITTEGPGGTIEVEVGQLKNDVTVFQLEASDRTNSRRATEYSSSTHSGVGRSSHESVPPQTPPRDEDINSIESGPAVNLNRILGVPEDDESTVGNSTMYDSSIDGYSAVGGYSEGMLRQR